MPTNNVETEVKLIIPDLATFDALQQLDSLGDFGIVPVGTKNIVDRYLDTSDLRLCQAGFACRVRQGQGQQILTLKSLTPVTDKVHRRLEIEMEVDTDQPPDWTEGEAKDLVQNIIEESPLQTLFTLYQTRHKFHVYSQQQRIIELSLDKVSLHQATAIDYLGLEAELIKDGTETDLVRFTKRLQQDWPLEVDSLSKFERALATLRSK